MSAGKSMKLELHADFPYEEEAEHAGLGTTRVVGYAVKGTPVRLTLKLISKAKVSMSHADVQLHLLMEETYAPVDIGERPIRWESTASGSVLTCETRLLVLSTQVCLVHFLIPCLMWLLCSLIRALNFVIEAKNQFANQIFLIFSQSLCSSLAGMFVRSSSDIFSCLLLAIW